jgi:hypothetical protein
MSSNQGGLSRIEVPERAVVRCNGYAAALHVQQRCHATHNWVSEISQQATPLAETLCPLRSSLEGQVAGTPVHRL